MNINEIQEQIIEEFSFFDDWMDKYSYLIEQSKEMTLIEDKYKIEENLIAGCQSKVWLHSEYKEGRLYFFADSDAIITKGIVGLLVRVLSGQPAEDVANADLHFIDKIGLRENLSPTRANGLVSMIKQMKLYAMAYIYKNQKK